MKYWLRRGTEGLGNQTLATDKRGQNVERCEASQGEYNSYYVRPDELKDQEVEVKRNFRSVSASPVAGKRAATPPSLRKLSPVVRGFDSRPQSPTTTDGTLTPRRKPTPPSQDLFSTKLVQRAEAKWKDKGSTLPNVRSSSPYSQLSSTPYSNSGLSAVGCFSAEEKHKKQQQKEQKQQQQQRRRHYSREEVDSAIDVLKSRTSSPK